MLTNATFEFEKSFGVPIGHTLRRPDPPPGAGQRLAAERWEHEEYDNDGRLVAVYESWARERGGLFFVKYSPYGWVLSISGRSPRHPPTKQRVQVVAAAKGG